MAKAQAMPYLAFIEAKSTSHKCNAPLKNGPYGQLEEQ